MFNYVLEVIQMEPQKRYYTVDQYEGGVRFSKWNTLRHQTQDFQGTRQNDTIVGMPAMKFNSSIFVLSTTAAVRKITRTYIVSCIKIEHKIVTNIEDAFCVPNVKGYSNSSVGTAAIKP
jgi:glutaredoxin-related protein